MELCHAAYGFPQKNIIIHVGGTTITQSEYGVTCLYFPEPSSPEYRKVGGEFYFETSDTKITLIPDIALENDILDEPKKTDTNQIVFTLYVGSFILKVNDFIMRLKHCIFTEKEIRKLYQGYKFTNSAYYNLLTMESEDFNRAHFYEGGGYNNENIVDNKGRWVFFYDTVGDYDDMRVFAVPDDEKIMFGNLREGDSIPFPGAYNVTYKVTKVERTEWGGIDVTVQKYESGTSTNESYTVHGYRSYDSFLPSIPPRVYC